MLDTATVQPDPATRCQHHMGEPWFYSILNLQDRHAVFTASPDESTTAGCTGQRSCDMRCAGQLRGRVALPESQSSAATKYDCGR